MTETHLRDDPAGSEVRGPALTRRRLLQGLGSAAALAAGGAVMIDADPASATTVTTLVPGSGHGEDNRVALQDAIDALPPGGTLKIPSGTFEIDVEAQPIRLRNSIAIVGAGRTATTFDVVPKDHQTNSFMVVDDGSSGNEAIFSGDFRFSDFSLLGPTQIYLTPWDTTTQGTEPSPTVYGLAWAVRTSVGQFTVERVTVTGAFTSAVCRSGIGFTRVIDCDLAAYVSAVAIYDDTNTVGASGAVIRGGVHRTGTNVGVDAKSSSVGIYIHPNVALGISDVTYQNFQRYGIYTNGEPDQVPTAWVAENITIDHCGGGIQTATKVDALLIGLRLKNGQEGPGTVLKGSATFVDCRFSGLTNFGIAGTDPDSLVQFIGCWIQPQDFFIAQGNGFGDGSDGTLRFVGCTALMTGNSLLDSGNAQWRGKVELLDCEVYDCGSTFWTHVYLVGGSLLIDNTTIHTNLTDPIVTDGIPVTGAPTILPATTCPPMPA